MPTDDAELAGRIVQEAYFSLAGYPHEDDYDRLLGDVASRAGEADVVVAIVDGQLVACLTFVADLDSPHAAWDDPDGAGFRYFGVSPTVQGRGVGEAMVQWCIDEAARLERKRLHIHTLECMTGAQRLYERSGFLRAPQHDAHWGDVFGMAFVREL